MRKKTCFRRSDGEIMRVVTPLCFRSLRTLARVSPLDVSSRFLHHGVVHEQRVGEWITVRRDEMGLSVRDFALTLSVDPKTVGNVEAGRTAVKTGTRSRWEDALGWERGSLTAAYRRGEPPRRAEAPADPIEAALDAARVPEKFRDVARRQLLAWQTEDRPAMGDRKIG